MLFSYKNKVSRLPSQVVANKSTITDKDKENIASPFIMHTYYLKRKLSLIMRYYCQFVLIWQRKLPIKENVGVCYRKYFHKTTPLQYCDSIICHVSSAILFFDVISSAQLNEDWKKQISSHCDINLFSFQL